MLGPIVFVDLLTSARRYRTFLLRLLYALIVACWFWLIFRSEWTRDSTPSHLNAMAHNFFIAYSYLQLFAILLVAPGYFASALSAEKERRILDFILTTDIRSHEVVLGKLVGRLVQILTLVIGGAPILFIAMLIGAIDPEHLIFVFASSLTLLAALASTSIMINILTKRSRDAMLFVYTIVAIYIVSPLFLGSLVGTPSTLGQIAAWLVSANALYSFTVLEMGGGTDVFWASITLVIAHGAVSILALIVSVFTLRRAYVHQTYGQARAKRRIRLFKNMPITGNAMIWKELWFEGFSLNSTSARIAFFLYAICIVGPSAWFFVDALVSNPFFSGGASVSRTTFSELIAATMAIAGPLAFMMIAGRAAGCITSEREKSTWNEIISTPLRGVDILIGKTFGLIATALLFLTPIFLVLAMGVITFSLAPLSGVALVFELAIYSTTALAIGLSFSLRCKTSVRAMLGSLGSAFFLAGGYMFCCAIMIFGPGRMEFAVGGFLPVVFAMSTFAPSGPAFFFGADDEVVAAIVLWILVHLSISTVLFILNISDFERLAGRASGRAKSSPPLILSRRDEAIVLQPSSSPKPETLDSHTEDQIEKD